jgi:hypothetical protein
MCRLCQEPHDLPAAYAGQEALEVNMDALATPWRLPPDLFPGQPLATVLYCIDDRTIVITDVMLNGRDVLVVREIETAPGTGLRCDVASVIISLEPREDRFGPPGRTEQRDELLCRASRCSPTSSSSRNFSGPLSIIR